MMLAKSNASALLKSSVFYWGNEKKFTRKSPEKALEPDSPWHQNLLGSDPFMVTHGAPENTQL